jgi:PAS domain S-box-containing protein
MNFKSKEHPEAEKTGKQSQTNENLFQLIENAGDGIVGISRNGIVTLWNNGAEEILGYTKNETIGQNIDIVIPWYKKHKKQLLFDVIISGGELINDFKTERVTKDGRRIVIMGTVSPIKDHSDNVIGASWIFRELSTEDSVQKDIAHFEKLISLGKLAAEIAHQINSPLGAVSGRIQMLLKNLDRFDKENLRKNLKQMLDSCNHVEIAIGRLLDYSRKPKRVMKPVDINIVIDDVLKMMAHRLMLKLINVNKTLTEGLPAMVGAYEELIHAFVNLISNSVDAMDEGGRLEVITDIDRCSEKTPKDRIRVTISDNGNGISEENLKEVFNPFYTTKDEGQGTGLGLSIVKRIVESHNSSIDILSKLNYGTSIILSFPCLIDNGK